MGYLNIADTTQVWGVETYLYPCTHGCYNGKHFIVVVDSINGNIVPVGNQNITVYYWTS